MVVGGGIGDNRVGPCGVGVRGHSIEKTPSIGGVMSELDKTFPTNDCSMCTLSRSSERPPTPPINLMTMSEVTRSVERRRASG